MIGVNCWKSPVKLCGTEHFMDSYGELLKDGHTLETELNCLGYVSVNNL